MKTSAKKIFERTKLINNRRFALQQKVPNLFLQASTQNMIENLSIIKKVFDGNMAYFGQGADQFLTRIPESKSNNLLDIVPKTMYLCDIHRDLLNDSISQIQKLNNPKIKIMNFDQELEEDILNIVPINCEEELWPFPDESLQLIIANMNLHWVNEVQVTLQRCLISDGMLMGSMFGTDTLQELRIAFTLAENERHGGISQHVSPFITVTEIGNLLTRLSYTMPTVFSERNSYEFDSVWHLMQYLQNIGENEALSQKRSGVYRDTLYGMCAIYESLFRNENSRISSTFETIYFSGWKFHPDQQQAKTRGSAEISLKSIRNDIEGMKPDEVIEYGEIGEEDSD